MNTHEESNGSVAHAPVVEPVAIPSDDDLSVRLDRFEAERDRLLSDLRDERNRLAARITDINEAIARLDPQSADVASEDDDAGDDDDRVSSHRAPGSTRGALIRFLEQHPQSGLSEIASGLGWPKERARSALTAAKKAGAVVATGDRMRMTYSAA